MKTLRNAFQTIYQRNAVLAIVGLSHLIVGLVLVLYLPFESRQVLGINLWIKPIKFLLSSAIYLWTFAVFLPYVEPRHPKAVRFIAWSIAIAMIVENTLINMQAARGTLSHFNESSPFDGIVFGVMGMFIAFNTIVVLYATLLFFLTSPVIARPYLWGIRLGLVIFMFGSMVGGMMVGLRSHNVGIAMGEAGLPFVNWSTQGGDLRIAHFLGLHGLQIIPLIGYLIARFDKPPTAFRSVLYVLAVSIAYAGVTALLYAQAMSGHPLIAGFK
jgi:hypothetical protein